MSLFVGCAMAFSLVSGHSSLPSCLRKCRVDQDVGIVHLHCSVLGRSFLKAVTQSIDLEEGQ